jgi:hypothetical protein
VSCGGCGVRPGGWGDHTLTVAPILSRRAGRAGAEFPRFPNAGAVCPGAVLGRAPKRVSCVPGALLDRGPTDLGGSGLVGVSGVRESPRSSREPGSSREIRESGPAPVPLAPPATTTPGLAVPGPEWGDQTGNAAPIVSRPAGRPAVCTAGAGPFLGHRRYASSLWSLRDVVPVWCGVSSGGDGAPGSWPEGGGPRVPPLSCVVKPGFHHGARAGLRGSPRLRRSTGARGGCLHSRCGPFL